MRSRAFKGIPYTAVLPGGGIIHFRSLVSLTYRQKRRVAAEYAKRYGVDARDIGII